MKKAILLLLALFVFTPVFVNAQTGEVYVDNIRTSKDTYSIGESVNGVFDLLNVSSSRQSDIYYTISTGELIGQSVYAPVGKSKMFGPFYANGDSKQKIDFNYKLPDNLSGSLGIEIVATLKDGTILAWDEIPITVNGSVQKPLNPDVWALLLVNSDSHGLQDGPTIVSGDVLSIELNILDEKSNEISPTVVFHNRIKSTAVVGTAQLEGFTTLEQKITKQSLVIPVDLQPGVYEGTLILDSDSSSYADIDFRFVVGGQIATINNINSSKLSPKSGEKFTISVSYSGTPEAYNQEAQTDEPVPVQLNVEIVNESGGLVFAGSKEVDISVESGEVEFGATSNLDAERLSVMSSIVGSGGTILSTYKSDFPDEVAVNSQESLSGQGSSFLVYIIVALILILVLVFLANKTKNKELLVSLVIILFGVTTAFGINEVSNAQQYENILDSTSAGSHFANITGFNSPHSPDVHYYKPGEDYNVEYSASYQSCLNAAREIESYYLDPTNSSYTTDEGFLKSKDVDWWRDNAINVDSISEDSARAHSGVITHEIRVARGYLSGTWVPNGDLPQSSIMNEFTGVLMAIARENSIDLTNEVSWRPRFTPVILGETSVLSNLYPEIDNSLIYSDPRFDSVFQQYSRYLEPRNCMDSGVFRVAPYSSVTSSGAMSNLLQNQPETSLDCIFENNFSSNPDDGQRNEMFNAMLNKAAASTIGEEDPFYLKEEDAKSKSSTTKVSVPGFNAPNGEGKHRVYLYTYNFRQTSDGPKVATSLAFKDICVSSTDGSNCEDSPTPHTPELTCSSNPETVNEGDTVTFTANLTNPKDPQDVRFMWDNGPLIENNSTYKQTFETSGDYNVHLFATSGDEEYGIVSCPVSVGVAVDNNDFTLTCDPSNNQTGLNPGDSVNYSVTASHLSDGYVWSSDLGVVLSNYNPPLDTAVTATFSNSGEVSVSATRASDGVVNTVNCGQGVLKTKPNNNSNLPIVSCVTPSGPLYSNTPLIFNANVSNAEDPVIYTWDGTHDVELTQNATNPSSVEAIFGEKGIRRAVRVTVNAANGISSDTCSSLNIEDGTDVAPDVVFELISPFASSNTNRCVYSLATINAVSCEINGVPTPDVNIPFGANQSVGPGSHTVICTSASGKQAFDGPEKCIGDIDVIED